MKEKPRSARSSWAGSRGTGLPSGRRGEPVDRVGRALRVVAVEEDELLGAAVDPALILQNIMRDVYEGVPLEEGG